MASAVNLGLAAFAGLAVGAGATLVLRRDEHNKAGSEPRQPQQPGSPSTALPMPASSPSSAYQSGYGGTTTTTTTRPSSTAQPHAFPTEQTKVQTPGPPSSSSSSAAARTFDPRLTGVALARRVTDPVSIGEFCLQLSCRAEWIRGPGEGDEPGEGSASCKRNGSSSGLFFYCLALREGCPSS